MNIFREYISYGLSVIPCEMKRPVIAWKEFQLLAADDRTANTWKATQIAIICGAVSGGVICIDFDVKNGDQYHPWLLLINEQYPELLSKLVIEQSPSGGFHAAFRSDYKIGNEKLAINKENKCTIETRGEGGYFVCAPSPNYLLQYGDFGHIQKLTISETEFLLSAAKSLNEKIEENPQHEAEEPRNFSGLSPFDDFNLRNDIVSLLVTHGWKRLFDRKGGIYLQRPNKTDRSISATWNVIPDRFYCFSTSTPFINNTVYKASAVYSVLEFGGDYSAAARALRVSGFGEQKKNGDQKQPEPQKYRTELIKPSDIQNRIYSIKERGYQRGKTTGWPELDKYYSVIKGQFTVITGMPSHGKSEFMDALAVNLMAKNNWKFAVFSPENYPVEMHYHKLIEKITGWPLHETENKDIDDAIRIISEYFFFIDALEDDVDLDAILGQTEILIKEKNIDGLIIDPWNEIELSKPRDINESDFIGTCLRRLRKFARRHKIHLWVICHPTKMRKNEKTGEYDIPELYDCAGSAHWRNKADNGLCIHRNMAEETTSVNIQKIKFRYAGKPGVVTLKYDERNGRYEEANSFDSDSNRYKE